ncbi:MAG TPA: DUF4350 domain-containing protein [Candidatus Binatia bacterium]|nr:DUF4350 domain-containing protein [Candidatus Binatia bacterium]
MRALVIAMTYLAFASVAWAQQMADPDVDLSVAAPAFAAEAGPRVVIDGAHHNFHTVDGRYAPFAQLLRNDGFRVSGSTAAFTDESLANVEVLVIANALAAEDVEEWRTPNPSAFTAEEIAAVRRFVERGGALLLIADHMPFGGAAQDLGAAFGVTFDNGFATDQNNQPDVFTRQNGGLADDPLLANIQQVRTFTGSAFRAPQARPLLRLDARYEVLLPEVAWEFSDETARVSGAGRLQGAVLEIGSGRVAVFGEAAMFTAQIAGPQRIPTGLRAPGAEENKAFALTVVRWLGRAS